MVIWYINSYFKTVFMCQSFLLPKMLPYTVNPWNYNPNRHYLPKLSLNRLFLEETRRLAEEEAAQQNSSETQ